MILLVPLLVSCPFSEPQDREFILVVSVVFLVQPSLVDFANPQVTSVGTREEHLVVPGFGRLNERTIKVENIMLIEGLDLSSGLKKTAGRNRSVVSNQTMCQSINQSINQSRSQEVSKLITQVSQISLSSQSVSKSNGLLFKQSIKQSIN